MPSSEYWKRRAEATLLAGEKSELEYEKQLRKAYERAILNIEKEIEAFYNKYASNNEIDLATARQRLNPSQLKSFKKQAQIYLDEVERLGLDPQYKKYLRNLSAKAYVTKLQEVLTNIQHQVEKLTTEFHDGLGEQLKYNYEDAFYRTRFDLDRNGMSTMANFTALGAKQLDQAIKTKWLGDNYSNRIWSNKGALISQLNRILPQEFVRGRGARDVAKVLQDKLHTSYSNAVRLARTEMNHISNQATMNAYKSSEVVKYYEYLATLDTRTSEICRELDGKVFKLSEAEAGINLPPMHPYCRSTTVPWFEDDDTEYDRIAVDEEGNNILLGRDMTYKEWAEEYTSKDYYERRFGQAKPNDLEQYTRYASVLRELAPATVDDFVNLKKNDPEAWETLKSQYRTINRYEIPPGVSAQEVLELDSINWNTKLNAFKEASKNKQLDKKERSRLKDLATSGNVGTMKLNNEIYFSHSSVTSSDKYLYNGYKGEYPFVDRPVSSPFTTKDLGDGIPRTADTEYRFFTYAASKLKSTDSGKLTILSEKHICESCLGVMEQFKKNYPNIEVTVISGKLGYNKDDAGRKTYRYRKSSKKTKSKD